MRYDRGHAGGDDGNHFWFSLNIKYLPRRGSRGNLVEKDALFFFPSSWLKRQREILGFGLALLSFVEGSSWGDLLDYSGRRRGHHSSKDQPRSRCYGRMFVQGQTRRRTILYNVEEFTERVEADAQRTLLHQLAFDSALQYKASMGLVGPKDVGLYVCVRQYGHYDVHRGEAKFKKGLLGSITECTCTGDAANDEAKEYDRSLIVAPAKEFVGHD
ncbi:hypothetical protein VNO77_27720 [Canavalia gladiata]|uniref:Uncharacterized protein n=1 Tax=Canavalia gladiata TaxID=3824 RepID=A0AAN9KV79_CANGL